MVSTTLFCSFSLTGLERLITRETVAIEHPLFFAINLISIFAIFKIPLNLNNQFLEENPSSTTLPIPENSINKAPSAELRPNQKDSDSLPDYPVLDRILKEYLENCKTTEEILNDFEKESLHVEEQTIEKVIRLVKINEWKRRQCPTAIKLTNSCFGIDRKVPIS